MDAASEMMATSLSPRMKAALSASCAALPCPLAT